MPYKLILNGKVIAILAACLLTVKFFIFLTGMFTGLWIGYTAQEYRAAQQQPAAVESEMGPVSPAATPAPASTPVRPQPVMQTPVVPPMPQPRVSVTASHWRSTPLSADPEDTLALDRFRDLDRREAATLFSEDAIARNRETESNWADAEEPAVVADSYDTVPGAADPAGFNAPEPEPRPTAPEFSGDAYSFQVGAFRDSRNAETMARDLRSRGYDVQVLPEPGKDGLTAVRVGHFREREMAQQAASVFRVNEQLPAWVRRSSSEAD